MTAGSLRIIETLCGMFSCQHFPKYCIIPSKNPPLSSGLLGIVPRPFGVIRVFSSSSSRFSREASTMRSTFSSTLGSPRGVVVGTTGFSPGVFRLTHWVTAFMIPLTSDEKALLDFTVTQELSKGVGISTFFMIAN